MLPNLLRVVTVMVVCSTATVDVSAGTDDFNIELKQKDAEVYHEQSFGRNEFNYGYQVEKTNSQFQHKAKGPDDVTYGCYGYIDPDGEKHLVYYIADRLGYRLLAPDQPTKVFTDRVANSVNKLDAELQGRKLDEKVVAWNDLYLPATCRRLNEIVSITPPPTATPVHSTTARNGAPAGAVHPVRPTGPKEPTIPSPTDVTNGNGEHFGGGQHYGDNSGAGVLQVPAVDESNNAGLKADGGVSAELPRQSISVGLGVSKTPAPELEVENSNLYPGGLNNGGVDGNVDGVGSQTITEAPREQEVYKPPQHTTPQPTPAAKQEVYTPPPRTTPQPIPPAKQIDPIVLLPDTTYVPIAHTTPNPPPRLPELHRPNCGHQGPNPQPRYPAPIGQFNGFVFPINRDCDASGRSTAELLAQMQAINELVLKVSATLSGLAGEAPEAARNGTCERVLQLLNIQQPAPLLVYVPIMIPYLEGGIQAGAGAQKPPINPASYAYAKSCSECK